MARSNDSLQFKPRRGRSTVLMVLRRFLFVLLLAVVLVVSGLMLVLNTVFKGPSPAARQILTMSLLEPSATKWIPGLFLDDETLASIRAGSGTTLTETVSDTSAVVIRPDASGDKEWEAYPDGIRIESVEGDTFNAHVMIIRDPSRVYLGVSNKEGFSRDVPGKRINQVMEEEDIVAAVNAGAFYDNGKATAAVGSTPEGLVYSEGQCVWSTGAPPNGITGFAGFTHDNVLVVHQENITQAQAEELNIRDGCCFGPVLIMNGEVSMEAYNSASGYNPRTALGQRRDSAVIFLCIDGRQAGSLGGTYADIIDIMLEYGAYTACNMDGGSSSVMLYRDTYGRYGEAGEVRMMNTYSVIQAEPRKMPNFWMVRPASEG